MAWRRWLTTLLLVCAAPGTGTAQTPESTAPQCPPQAPPPDQQLMLRAHEQATDRGFLWRISRDGRDSFLYGTLHAGRPEWFALGPRTEASLFRTGALALEINVTDPAVPRGLKAVIDGPPRALPSELMQALRAVWRSECLPEADLSRGPAELHMTQVAVAQARRQGLFALYSAESVLLMRSLRAERPVVGLESVQAQLAALMARDDAEAAVMVADGLAELRRPQATAALERLALAWAGNDLETLQTYAQWCDCVNTPGERESLARMTDGRNPGMADAIERLHAGMSVFAAVGSLHLVGPQGLPSLLKARGFVVTRVF
jgi:hypothetical protein